jgi:hypothetical protein
MAAVIVRHPVTGFSGYARVAGRGLLFSGGFSGLVDLTAAQQTTAAGAGYIIDGVSSPDAPPGGGSTGGGTGAPATTSASDLTSGTLAPARLADGSVPFTKMSGSVADAQIPSAITRDSELAAAVAILQTALDGKLDDADSVELAATTAGTLTPNGSTSDLAADAAHTHRLPNADASGYITLTTADGTPVKLLVTNGVVGAGGGAAVTAPGQVTGLTAGTPTNTTVPLSWTAPSAGSSPITDYLVQYRVAGASSWSTFADGTSTTTSATVTGLTAGTAYELHSAAVSAVGMGPFSATITATTTGTASAPAGTGFTDSFARSDGAVGNGWSAIGSTNAVVASSKLMKTNNNYSAGGVRRDLALASGTLTVTVSNPGDAGIIFRWLSDSDFYAYYDHEIWHHAAGGARTKAVDSVGRVDSAAGATLSVVMDGTNVTAYTDGTLTHNFTETTNAASTNHGIFLNTTAVTADDFNMVPR